MKYKTILLRVGQDDNGICWNEIMIDWIVGFYSDRDSIPVYDGTDGPVIGKVVSVSKQKDEFGTYLEGICDLRQEPKKSVVGLFQFNIKLIQGMDVQASFPNPKIERVVDVGS